MQVVSYTRGYATINLDSIQQNIESMKSNLHENTQMMLIVKADGYGHGAIPVAKTFESIDYIWGFGVATLDEGIILRNAGITKPILILGCVFPEQYAEVLQHDIRINIYNEEMAQEISRLAKLANTSVHMHIKIDSGMTRLGFLCNDESLDSIEAISKLDNVILEGIFTHFAKADEEDKTYTNLQFEAFLHMINSLEARNIFFELKHCSNSAGIIDHPECNMDIVRAGISLYGLYPSEEVLDTQVPLVPALSFISSIASIKEIKAGTAVSYGGIFKALQDMKIATVPIGYADGYARSLSNQGYVLVNGRKAPIIGRICMDQFMIDVTAIDDAAFMTPVVLIGESDGVKLPVETLSEISGRFNYEFICGINKRIPRIYIKNGEIEDQIDYFA
ncbi:MAG: alanine racemase [Eubacteriales bacterium]